MGAKNMRGVGGRGPRPCGAPEYAASCGEIAGPPAAVGPAPPVSLPPQPEAPVPEFPLTVRDADVRSNAAGLSGGTVLALMRIGGVCLGAGACGCAVVVAVDMCSVAMGADGRECAASGGEVAGLVAVWFPEVGVPLPFVPAAPVPEFQPCVVDAGGGSDDGGAVGAGAGIGMRERGLDGDGGGDHERCREESERALRPFQQTFLSVLPSQKSCSFPPNYTPSPQKKLCRSPLSRSPLSRSPLSRSPLSRSPLSRSPLSRSGVAPLLEPV